nr:hypothetical protein [Pseudomonas savastanoi]
MFSLPCLYVIARFLWPMPWALSARIAVALLLVLASQYHLYCRFSSGSVFSPEFPRTVVMLFNWAFGAILLLAVLQIIVDIATLLTMLMRRQALTIPANLRYVIGVAALALAAIGVQQAVRVPPVKDIQIAIKNLPVQFEGYKVLQLTDMHISRLFDAPWTMDAGGGAAVKCAGSESDRHHRRPDRWLTQQPKAGCRSVARFTGT